MEDYDDLYMLLHDISVGRNLEIGISWAKPGFERKNISRKLALVVQIQALENLMTTYVQ